MNLKNIPNQYRPIPFWSWNEKLDTDETRNQVQLMSRAGIGGFFMHARGGLQTEYMGDEWFENVSAAVDEAAKTGMHAWAYDENGWPSGFGDGSVNGLGIEYQQKYLRMSETEHTDNFICKSGDKWFYYEVNPFYVDTLDKKVVAEFLKISYQPYYERYKNKITGFFTDEPQISRKGIPWSFVFEEEYMHRYGEDIRQHLEELFNPVSDYKATRIKFWKMVTDLFSEAYFKQIYEWCDKRGLKITGHLVLEESLLSQLTTNGACMPHYEYFHIPGMDWLGRNISDCLTPIQVASAAAQSGKEQVLSETFALCGHNMSFEEMKGIYEWQMVHGINLLCQHLEGYSIRGMRKRDYPPAMYYQQPWWEEYGKLIDAFSRESMLLANGKPHADVLLIHPQTTAWSMFDNGANEGIQQLNDNFLSVIKELEEKHILFHLGDETIIERHAKVEKDKFIIGTQTYSYILNPCGEILLPRTEVLLREFVNNGGKIVRPEELKDIGIIDRKDITYTERAYDGFNLYYFVNTSAFSKKANISVSGKAVDIYTGELTEFCGTHEFEPWGSLMMISDDSSSDRGGSDETVVKLSEKCGIIGDVENTLALDRCDYYFDGELQEKNGYVLNIAERANKLERRVHIRQEYHISAEYIPKELYLICETPERFRIHINGREIDKNICGWFRDKSLKKIDISGYMKFGENTISFECDFEQRRELYDNLKKARCFESEKNKLAYDMEIEAVYLSGSFSVKTDGEWIDLEKNAVRYNGDFVIAPPKREIYLRHIEQQGFPFFSGKLCIAGTIDIKGSDPVLVLNRKGINAVKVEINNIEKTMLTNNKLKLNDFGVSGKAEIRLTIINNLRNLLGPHHLKSGESYSVGPGTFYKEPCIWNPAPERDWDERYCFVEMSL